jgi:hypothetical protein
VVTRVDEQLLSSYAFVPCTEFYGTNCFEEGGVYVMYIELGVAGFVVDRITSTCRYTYIELQEFAVLENKMSEISMQLRKTGVSRT